LRHSDGHSYTDAHTNTYSDIYAHDHANTYIDSNANANSKTYAVPTL